MRDRAGEVHVPWRRLLTDDLSRVPLVSRTDQHDCPIPTRAGYSVDQVDVDLVRRQVPEVADPWAWCSPDPVKHRMTNGPVPAQEKLRIGDIRQNFHAPGQPTQLGCDRFAGGDYDVRDPREVRFERPDS